MMFSKCCMWGFLKFIVIFLYLQGAAGFFVKHVQTGMCIYATSKIQVTANWGKLFAVKLSNNCLDPAFQFRFLDNSAMFSLERKNCFEGKLSTLYFLLATENPTHNCVQNHAITQTSWGGLSVYDVYYKQTRCAVPKTYIKLTDCSDAEDKRFNFGSVTCHGKMIEYANCPKDQYMVVKTASYRGLSDIKTCGLSDDHSCEVDVTCLVKKQCDGQHECNITVNETLFSGDLCPGLTKYLYFEYQCNATSFKEICVDAVSLSYSSLPNEGFVKITTDSRVKNVCWQSLGNAKDVVCRQLGYKQADSLVEKAAPSDLTDEIFSGSIVCDDGDKKLSHCSVTNSSQSCSKFSYLKCHICPRPLLRDNHTFPDSSFTSPASSKSHSPSDARISSGSSWCAPAADGKHYLQVDLGRLYVIYYFVTFGDTTSPNWVTTYNLNFTVDLKNWRSVNQTTFQGNKNAYKDAAIRDYPGGITTRALRFMPLKKFGQPCMRIEICGATRFPDKPTNLTVTNIKSRSAEISWADPENTGDGNLIGFSIKLKKQNSLIQNTTEDKVNEYKLDNLKPYTVYEISVAARNKHSFGNETITSFKTSEDAPEGPPLNVTVISESPSSLTVTWEPPEKDKRNGMIVNYTVCISHEESESCFKEQTTEEKMLVIASLNVSTKYYVRVLASTKVGSGNYSESREKFTTKGSVTCHGEMIKNTNCPKDQYMVVKNASYRGLNDTKTCGLSDDYSCEVDVTCLVKKQCDGQHECSITVNETLFSGDHCSGLRTYLYFEYQCINTPTPFEEICVDGVSLSHSTLPNEGLVQIATKYSGTKSVCWQSLTNEVANIVCRQLGYMRMASNVSEVLPPSHQDGTFSGSIECTSGAKNLSQCSFTISNESCSKISYIKCFICDRPLLEDKQRFPDSSFTASPSEGRSPSDARISSNSSWCAPAADGKYYLQVNLGRLYVIYNFVTFGDTTSAKWVTTYNLNYTDDLMNWKSVWNHAISGNKDAYNDAAIQDFPEGITARALRFIPLRYEGEPCMRIEICGATLFPDKPTNLTVINVKSRSTEISWADPNNIGDGNLTGVWIKLKKENSLIQNNTKDKVNEYELNNLKPYTKYEISVAAGNKHGFGKETITSFTTSEDAPEGPPLNVTVIAQTSSSLSVTWKPPEKDKRNGIIDSYTVCISHEESEPCFKGQTTKEKMCNLTIGSLNASTKYYVRVLARTKVGPGNYSKSTGKFTNGDPPKLPTNGTETTLTFLLLIPSQKFTHFYVVALKLKDGQESQSPASYENNDLVTYAEAEKSTDPKPYIAAIVTSKDGDMFILGDGTNTSNPTSRRRRSTSSDYYNGPLEPGTNYSIFQRIFINDKGDYYSSDWSPASKTVGKETLKMTTASPTNIETTKLTEISREGDSGNVGGIVGAIVGVCVLLVLVILAIIMFRRRKDKQQSQPDYQLEEELDKQSGPPEMNDAFSNDFEMRQNANDGGHTDDDRVDGDINDTDPDDFYANKESIVARVHNPIPVEEFNDHVNHQRKNDNKEFNLDFEDLPTGRISNWDIAKRSFNIPKNRYGNAVTYNHSRVILSGDEKTDYINASFIDGLTEKYYIATQGPKPKTVNDFWRMIFEHKCPTIVMLTTLKEMGKTKCEKYWPDEASMYGDINVTPEQTKTFADYVTRTFIVEKGGEQHEVQQYHFVSWPDYGVPLYPTQILTFRRHFKSFHETSTGPAVVHCSAGVGRSGVFIAVDKILDDLEKEKKDTIDIFGFVKDMRTRRANMVQTAEQYVFIHDTIVDHLNCGANEVEATQITFEIKNLLKKNDKDETGFDKKFKRLNTVTPQLVKEKCEAALLDQNKKKNRTSEIYPSESDRPYLKHIDNVENSDYINACYVDGYLGKRYFIATQTPLEETINDFWRMVLQHKSSTIVMLNQLREGYEEYPMFWPTKRATPQSFGPSTVMLDSFVKKENIVIRKFVVSPSADLKEGRMVRLIQYMSWPGHGVPKDVDDIAKILSEVEESQRAAEGKGPVTVICSDGAGRSGTYIAISNLVDRVKVVQVIDVFQCVKLIRTKRPQFVETAAQFKLCYDAVTSVLRSFNEYSNFESEVQNYSTSFVD